MWSGDWSLGVNLSPHTLGHMICFMQMDFFLISLQRGAAWWTYSWRWIEYCVQRYTVPYCHNYLCWNDQCDNLIFLLCIIQTLHLLAEQLWIIWHPLSQVFDSHSCMLTCWCDAQSWILFCLFEIKGIVWVNDLWNLILV